MAELRLTISGSDDALAVRAERLVIAGYTARDDASVREHIDELARIGVPPPPTVPMFYHLDPGLLTTDEVVDVAGDLTSGEVEPVLVRAGGRWYLGVGSDHTDRDLEREDIGTAKAACPKPLGDVVVPLPDDLAAGAYDTAWDRAHARCEVDDTLYQDGPVAVLRQPSDLLPRLSAELTARGEDPEAGDLVVFTGTLPLVGGEFRAGRSWHLELTLDGGPTVLTHRYDVKQRSS
ncbi:MAG: DUF2848 domain-containing protein [Streptosporangiales bacterium]|nr:DUF2848 domain-containing protein [Streptosporangiales bacterium]